MGMKRFILMSGIVTLMGSVALADPASSPSRTACREMRTACQTAGFTAGAEQGKKLYRDCMLPLMDGKSVAGVTVSTQTIAACRARGREKK
jgi:hypothetical protein